ncbi:hypothetical protein Cyrtocomes_00412 [Candidatus Cyrtobacter comes]|uniref:Uncharacterized protein n=1 Tax=Candidatus Cyrtobacter comes TaxID=675776 RepID=A0ABU5L7D5_9RICK|nr:hypothetical protein [Candidatus Cyrtobacter comes]MDZ5762046.1 hypothetical protein [Candidatus Cyrtobacter comes]
MIIAYPTGNYIYKAFSLVGIKYGISLTERDDYINHESKNR